jgi:LmbE family N-acetylglucosaminyl deacetylase
MRKVAAAALVVVFSGSISSVRLHAQQSSAQEQVPTPHVLIAPEPNPTVLPLPEDRGHAGLERALKQLGTTASVLMIVAHPDDEDGALLTYLSRGLGSRVTLLTLTRGEGGQNAMSAASYDALGLLRTSELLKADAYYGASQLWGTEADFGFSKTQEESFARWHHERVLYDAVLAVRTVRPQVIVATFLGGITDGHGQHQVSGEIAQEAFKMAGDANVFPEQLKNGLTPWQPLAVYSRTPFAPITDGKMFDYATGKSAPVRFHNYVTGEWIERAPSADATMPVGDWDTTLGRSYTQIAREGWGEQKSQYGGASPALSGPVESNYHLWGATAEAVAKSSAGSESNDLFHNAKVSIDTSIGGLVRLAGATPPADLRDQLKAIDGAIVKIRAQCPGLSDSELAKQLAPVYRQTLALRNNMAKSSLDAQALRSLTFELDQKIVSFEQAFQHLLGLDLLAYRTRTSGAEAGGLLRGGSADETPRSVSPGEEFNVRVHAAHANNSVQLQSVTLLSHSGSPWKISDLSNSLEESSAKVGIVEKTFHVRSSDDAAPTAPFFTRPSIEQPYYDIAHEEWRERSFAPWPLTVWAIFAFDGVEIPVVQVVQTLERSTGPGGIYEPLIVTPAVGVRIEPEARVLPLDGSAIQVEVSVHAEHAAEGTVHLQLPDGWKSTPPEASFALQQTGDSAPILFSVQPNHAGAGAFTLRAEALSAGVRYQSGWRSIGYPGLQPYNQYKPAELKARRIDVKVAPGLRVGYVMGTGDPVPEALEELGVKPHLLAASELISGDLSAYDTIVIGIRAYSNRPDLRQAQTRLEEFVGHGGTLVVQYQSADFPAPKPLAMGRIPERVVDESTPVKLLAPADPLLNTPNKITTADFDGWVEERGHSFLDTWDKSYTALTETADQGQDAQRGGLLVAHFGRGTYVYVAYALHRQLPELVPGSYRLLANLISAGAHQ